MNSTTTAAQMIAMTSLRSRSKAMRNGDLLFTPSVSATVSCAESACASISGLAMRAGGPSR